MSNTFTATPERLPTPPRRPFAPTVVAVIYGLMVLCAPFVVRYGWSSDALTPSTAYAQLAAEPRCESAPEFGLSCRPVSPR